MCGSTSTRQMAIRWEVDKRMQLHREKAMRGHRKELTICMLQSEPDIVLKCLWILNICPPEPLISKVLLCVNQSLAGCCDNSCQCRYWVIQISFNNGFLHVHSSWQRSGGSMLDKDWWLVVVVSVNNMRGLREDSEPFILWSCLEGFWPSHQNLQYFPYDLHVHTEMKYAELHYIYIFFKVHMCNIHSMSV